MLVLCNGMIRSGSTLQYNLVSRLVETMEVGEGKGFYNDLRFEQMEDQFINWGKDKTLSVIKSHQIPPIDNQLMKVCFIYRDIRDVAVSVKKKWQNKSGLPLSYYLDLAMEAYDKAKNTDTVLWQKYEDVVADLPKAIREIANFLELNPSEEVIKEVVDKCSIDQAKKYAEILRNSPLVKFKLFLRSKNLKLVKSVKKMALNLGIPESAWRSEIERKTILHGDHISESAGKIGVWQEELSQEEIEMIKERYQSWFLETGYLN